MSQLHTLQKQFQDYLLGDTNKIVHAIFSPATPKNFAKKRLNVYGEAYLLRLLGILTLEFPGLSKYLGEEEFEGLVLDYLDCCPSQSPSVRDIGERLSQFLRETLPYSEQPLLGDLAAFEWALTIVTDLPDAPVLTQQALTQVSEILPDIRFTFHPSLHQLSLHWNVADIRNTGAEPIRYDTPQSWVIWRKGLMPYYLHLNSEEAWLLREMNNGCSFTELCEGLSECLPEEQVAPYIVQQLLRYINEEMLSEIILP